MWPTKYHLPLHFHRYGQQLHRMFSFSHRSIQLPVYSSELLTFLKLAIYKFSLNDIADQEQENVYGNFNKQFFAAREKVHTYRNE